MASHLFGLTQDIVDYPRKGKCGLKYVMYIPTKEIGEFTY